jgi:hemoglobin
MHDIQNWGDIELMVNTFYQKVRKDDLIGPIFASRIADDAWPAHLHRMYTFWAAILINEPGYSGQPFDKHRDMPIDQVHFDRWVSLFKQNVDLHFEGAVANEAKHRADLMAHIFMAKLLNIRAS